MKKNIFTDIAGHPYIYLSTVVFLYLISIGGSGLLISQSAKNINIILLLAYVYSMAFTYGTYLDMNYNLRYSSKGGILIFVFACMVVIFPLLIGGYVLVGRFLSGDFS